MPRPYNIPRLELDITGNNLDNKIIDEPHTLANTLVRAISPNYGPFFAESVIIKDGVNILQRGTDYQIVELHSEATQKYGKEISSVILILNANVSSNVLVTYQALGGHYAYSNTAIANIYQSVINDNRPVDWKNVFNKPLLYQPTNHLHLLNDVIGFEYIVDYLERIKQAISLGQVRVVYEIVNSLLGKFKCKELPKVLPSNKLIQYDALLYFLSRRKILSNIWIDITECRWYKGDVGTVEVDTSSYPVNTNLYWEFYKPDLTPTAVFSVPNGVIKSNGGIVRFNIYIPSIDNVTDYPIYLGIKENPLDEDYKAVTYVIEIVEHIKTDLTMPIIINNMNNYTLNLDIALLDHDSIEHYIYYTYH